MSLDSRAQACGHQTSVEALGGLFIGADAASSFAEYEALLEMGGGSRKTLGLSMRQQDLMGHLLRISAESIIATPIL